MVSSMSQIVKRRLVDICPDETVDSKSLDELVSDCNIAFKIIGYNPINLEKTVERVSKKLERVEWDHSLATFIFQVWSDDS